MEEVDVAMASEPAATHLRASAFDGLLAYITAQHASAATRWELGNRLLRDAEHDMRVRPAFELTLQIKEVCGHATPQERPSLDAIENAISFVNARPSDSLLIKAGAYCSNHATVMLKLIVNNTVASVDIGSDSFSYAIVNPDTLNTEMGEGTMEEQDVVRQFYNLLNQQQQDGQ